MSRVKAIADKKKAARLDKGAAKRFTRNALFDPEDKASEKKAAANKTPNVKPAKRPKKS